MRVMRRLGFILPVLLLLIGTGRARAVVVDSTQAGFLVRSETVVQAAPDSVYRALTARIGAWWDPEHTFSGDSRNLSLDATPGGCFCERLPGGGGVRHLTVAFASPGRLLRLTGALGPLQGAGIAGSLTWSLSPAPGGTAVRLDYSVGGYFPGGLPAMAPAVDAVLGAQVSRLKRLVETGRPDPK
jgi:uncharacterized protein YndB with AHSA1/START domain